MSDSSQPTRDQWRDRLLAKLTKERSHWELMHSYYRGDQGIPLHAEKRLADAAKRLMAMSMVNTAQMIVEAPLDRMLPAGCRTAAEGDELGDEVGDLVWRANNLTTKSSLVFEEQLSMGMGYMLVGPLSADLGVPLITVEDPRECTVIVDPATGEVLAGAKVFADGDVDRLYMYLPGNPSATVHRASRPSTASDRSARSDPPSINAWTWDDDGTSLSTTRVPLVPFPNSPDAAGNPHAEFEWHLGAVDRINYLTLQRLEITTLQAFRQRALRGAQMRDENGDEIDWNEILEAGPGSVWGLPETVELWESDAIDVRPLVEAEKHEMRQLAGVTGTPLFYVAPEATDGSAEGAMLAKEKLIFKTKRHIAVADIPMKQVLSISFEVMGEAERSQIADIEIIWVPPERFSLSETSDAATKALSAGLSRRSVLEDIWRKTPAEVARIEDDLVREALTAQGVSALTELVAGGSDPSGVGPAS